jgi:hypothetical protein
MGNMTNNSMIEDMIESEGDGSPVGDLRRMMIRMFNELKENMGKQLNEYQENMGKKNSIKTQKQHMSSEMISTN